MLQLTRDKKKKIIFHCFWDLFFLFLHTYLNICKSEATLSAVRFSYKTANNCVGDETIQLLQETFEKAFLAATVEDASHAELGPI